MPAGEDLHCKSIAVVKTMMSMSSCSSSASMLLIDLIEVLRNRELICIVDDELEHMCQ